MSFVLLLCCRGGADLLKKEGNLEVPSCQILVTKPQFVLISCIAESWVNSTTKAGKVASVPKAVIDSVFYPIGKQSMVLKTTATVFLFSYLYTDVYIMLYTYIFMHFILWKEDSTSMNYIYILSNHKIPKTTKLPSFNYSFTSWSRASHLNRSTTENFERQLFWPDTMYKHF